jgi:hypothetical protein
VELLPSSKSSSSSSKVAARVLFLSGVATLGFLDGGIGGGNDGVTGVERPLNPEAPGLLTCGGGTTRCGGVTTGRGRVSGAYDKGYWHDAVASLPFLVKQIS